MVIFDLDGVIYRGSEPVAGARDLVARLHAAGVLVRFATNNSMATREAYASRLAEMGIPSTADEIVTSTSATIDHLRRHLPGIRSVLAVGADGMLAELRAAGYDATHISRALPADYQGGELAARYDAVVAGLDQEFDYRRLAVAAGAIRAGARFVATNADQRYPTPTGFMPGAGAIVAALRAASGCEPLVIGKPEPAMFLAILERSGLTPADAVVVGDNPDADMVAASRAGIRAILVLTGVTDPEAVAGLRGERRPDGVAAGPSELAGVLGLDLS